MKKSVLNCLFVLLIPVILSSNTVLSLQKSTQFVMFSSHDKWKKMFNEDVASIHSLYSEHAVVIVENDTVCVGKEQINKLYQTLKLKWNAIDTVYTNYEKIDFVSAFVTYEIGTFITSDGEQYNHLIVWDKHNNSIKRELEVIYKKEVDTDAGDIVKKQRENWVRMANKHDVEAFLRTVFCDNSVYYWNSKNELYTGIFEIKDAYGYMADTNWSITDLQPLYMKQVHDSLIYEIGKYLSGGYVGCYTLVWKKNKKNEWKVFLDSNY
ncbi:MAG: hypothetical protein R6U95_01360 [Bacteroidales bacterium]